MSSAINFLSFGSLLMTNAENIKKKKMENKRQILKIQKKSALL